MCASVQSPTFISSGQRAHLAPTEHIKARLALPFKIKLILLFVVQAVMFPVQQEVYLLVPLLPKVDVSLMIELLMEYIGILAKV